MPDLQALARGYRILGMNGVGVGLLAHLTQREPGGQTFWSFQFGQSVEEVTPDSLREVDFDLRVVSGGGAVNRNLRIHSEIYAARPDVTCIVHHHGGNAIALGAIGANIFPYDRNAARWEGLIDLVDDYESPVLSEQGASIAAALGSRKALLLKHHGVLITGPNLQDVVVATVELERICEVQLKAMAAGSLHRLPEPEIHDAKAILGAQRIADGYWDYYCRRLVRQGLDIDQ